MTRSDRPSFMRSSGIAVEYVQRWVTGSGPTHFVEVDPEILSLTVNGRALVVIDPENREALARLAREIDGDRCNGHVTESTLAFSLREYINPTLEKPDEPTGIGAVVEDDKGELWVMSRPTAHNRWGNGIGDFIGWEFIAAAEVLSEGVRDD